MQNLNICLEKYPKFCWRLKYCCTVHGHILAFFALFIIMKIYISFATIVLFFFSLFFTEMIHFRSLFWGIPLLFWISSWQIFGHFYVGKKFIKKNDSKNVLGPFVWLVSLIAYSLKLYLKFNFELILFENIQGWII